mmetsp:Transcript_34532/g.87291  ORF Transcript_34532/g.87291 Transcript_34532/m.87291 type:complete len:91 (+) Transcript_34532:1063-1335(+)
MRPPAPEVAPCLAATRWRAGAGASYIALLGPSPTPPTLIHHARCQHTGRRAARRTFIATASTLWPVFFTLTHPTTPLICRALLLLLFGSG